MRYIVLVSLLCIVFGSCKKSVKYCGVNDPTKELPWLSKAIKQDSLLKQVYEANYNSIDGIFLEQHCDSCADLGSYFVTCGDSEVCAIGTIVGTTCPDFSQKVALKKLIFSR